MLVRAKILTTRFYAGIDVRPVTPCMQFFAKIIYVSERLEWAFSSVSSQPLLVTFYCVLQSTGKPSAHQFTMKAFNGDFIGTILAN